MFLVGKIYKSALKVMTLLFCFASISVMGDWSSPPEVIYPSSPPYTATYPYIATDGNGNSVAVWFDANNGSMQAATLASNAVNAQGQPAWVLTTPIASSGVQDPTDPYAQAVAMNASGQAIAVWTDQTYAYVATLSLGQTSWSAPTILNSPILGEEVYGLCVALAENGNAVVTWQSVVVGPYNALVYANVFNAQSQSWLGAVSLLSDGDYEHDALPNPVAIDPKGNAVVAINSLHFGNTLATSYDVNSGTWTQIPFTTESAVGFSYAAMDSSGNATIVWVEDNTPHEVHAATLLLNATSFINPVTLSTSSYAELSEPLVVTDVSGNAVVVWADESGSLASARYVFATSSWTVLPLLGLGGEFPFRIAISGDACGNVVASWIAGVYSDSYVQAATLASQDSSWGQLEQVSSSFQYNGTLQIVLTTNKNAVVIWASSTDQFDAGTINSSIFLGIFAPNQASYFTGKVVENRFLMQKDRIYQLNWGQGCDRSTVKYYLRRNGTLIATIPSSGKSSYTYDDHNRNKKVTDVYKLTSVNLNGEEGLPLFVTFK